MFNRFEKVFKKKVRFISKRPPIKSQREYLKKIEDWLNELIEKCISKLCPFKIQNSID